MSILLILKLHILLSEGIDCSIGIGDSITVHIVPVPAETRQHWSHLTWRALTLSYRGKLQTRPIELPY
jgi:hypothetical protein